MQTNMYETKTVQANKDIISNVSVTLLVYYITAIRNAKLTKLRSRERGGGTVKVRCSYSICRG